MSENESQKVFIPNLFERAKEVTFDVVLAELGLLDQLQVAFVQILPVIQENQVKAPVQRGDHFRRGAVHEGDAI